MAWEIKDRVDQKFIFLLLINWVLVLLVFAYYSSSVNEKFDEMKAQTLASIKQKSIVVRPLQTSQLFYDVTGHGTQVSSEKAYRPETRTDRSLPVKHESVEGFVATPVKTLQKMDLITLYNHYMKLVTNKTISCSHVVRYGNTGDGGWEVCQEANYRTRQPCLIYSMGINWEFSFDDAISRSTGCHVHSFDPSMKTKSFNRSNLIHFHNYGLKGANVKTNERQYINQSDFSLKTFDEILTSLGHKETTIDFFKMDIDGPEWPSLELMISNKLMRHVRQFAAEFHVFNWEFRKKKFLRTISILERLRESGFEMFLSHANPNGIYYNPHLNKNITCCHETYYLNTKYRIGMND